MSKGNEDGRTKRDGMAERVQQLKATASTAARGKEMGSGQAR